MPTEWSNDPEVAVREIEQSVLWELEGDWVDLRLVYKWCLRLGGSEEDALRLALSIAESLMRAGKMVPGEFTDDAYRVWAGEVDGWMAKINDGVRSLGRPPDIGEVVWFALPADADSP